MQAQRFLYRKMNDESDFEEIRRMLDAIYESRDDDLIQLLEHFIEEISQFSLIVESKPPVEFHIRFYTRLQLIRAKGEISDN